MSVAKYNHTQHLEMFLNYKCKVCCEKEEDAEEFYSYLKEYAPQLLWSGRITMQEFDSGWSIERDKISYCVMRSKELYLAKFENIEEVKYIKS